MADEKADRGGEPGHERDDRRNDERDVYKTGRSAPLVDRAHRNVKGYLRTPSRFR